MIFFLILERLKLNKRPTKPTKQSLQINLGFLKNVRRGAMRSKTQWVFYRDLNCWPGPQNVQFREITGYPEVVGLILALLKTLSKEGATLYYAKSIRHCQKRAPLYSMFPFCSKSCIFTLIVTFFTITIIL